MKLPRPMSIALVVLIGYVTIMVAAGDWPESNVFDAAVIMTLAAVVCVSTIDALRWSNKGKWLFLGTVLGALTTLLW